MYGLGPIGASVARQLATRKGFQIVGAVDIDHAKVGLDLGEVIGLGKKMRIRITNDPVGAIKAGKPDVAVLCTSSSLKKVMPQIETVLKKKVAIVSTTEELSYPVGKNRALAKKIDALAKKAKVAVVGTGVNPGFAMDALPITLTGICERVDSIRIDRIQDARSRRLPFQQKIGSGLNTEQFAQKVKDGSVRHVGLAESVTMIADAMGWKLDKVTDDIKPKIAEKAVESDLIAVDPGYVCGIIQDGVGYVKGKAVVTLSRSFVEPFLKMSGRRDLRDAAPHGARAHHTDPHVASRRVHERPRARVLHLVAHWPVNFGARFSRKAFTPSA